MGFETRRESDAGEGAVPGTEAPHLEARPLMNNRTRTLASFFSLAMAAMLLGAVVTTNLQPQSAQAAGGPAAVADPLPPTASAPSGPVTLDTFRNIARLQTPGVVNINTKRTVKRSSRGGSGGGRDQFRDFFGDDFMDRFFGPDRGGAESQTQRSLGSGFIVDREGYILTNRHVIEGADDISVTLSNQRPGAEPYEAKLIGKDARTDVALLKIVPKGDLTVLRLGDSEQTEPGEWVMAIGNPFGLGGNSVTVGVVSFKGRNLTLGVRGTGVDMIQTDAAINPGNSGGPLLNTRGEVIGINTMIVTGGLQQSAGVGFAVPINVAKEVLPQLREKGKVVRGWLGVQIQAVDEATARSFKMKEARGAVIAQITDGSPAEKAGLKPEDVVLSVDEVAIQDQTDLSRYVAGKAPGATVKLKILRGGEEKVVPVTLGTFPEETADATEESDEGGSAQLGMTLRNLTPELAERLDLPRGVRGVVVWEVEAGTHAEDSGLRRGDLIVTVNGANVEDVSGFEREIGKAKVDGVARLRVRRGDGYTLVTLRLD
jgi:serine protease Do